MENIPNFNFEVGSPEDNEQKVDTPTVDLDLDVEDNTDDTIEDAEIDYPEGADPNVMAAYQYYLDKGFISQADENFAGTPEALEQLLAKEDELRGQELYNSIFDYAPDWGKEFVELVLNKGKDLTREEAAKFFELTQAPEYKIEDFSEDAKAAAFLKKHYMKEYEDSEDDAEERIDLLKDKGKLKREAELIFSKEEKLRKELLGSAVEQAKESRQQQRLNEEQFNSAFVESVRNTTWRTDMKQAVADEFYTGRFKERMDHMIRNPNVLPILVAFASHYDGTKINLDSFIAQGLSKEVQKSKRNIESYWSGNRGSISKPTNNKGFNIEEFEIIS